MNGIERLEELMTGQWFAGCSMPQQALQGYIVYCYTLYQFDSNVFIQVIVCDRSD